jgi:hypothetical protein
MPLAPYAPPSQPSENVSAPAAVGVTVFDPVAARLPLQPPLAVQVVPVLDDQVTTADCPSVIAVGFTVTLTMAAGFMLDPPPYPPPPQLANIIPQKIPVTLRSAARCIRTMVSSKRKIGCCVR